MPALHPPAFDGLSLPAIETPTLQVGPIDDGEWLAFIRTQPVATAFHHPAWSSAIARSYGFAAMKAVLRDGTGRITAGLPMMLRQGPLSGRRLTALPFTDYCPPLARDRQALDEFVSELAAWWKAAGRLQFDIHAPLPSGDGIFHAPSGVRHLLDLEDSAARLEHRLRGAPVMRGVRKAQREGVRVRMTGSLEDLDAFYRLHWRTRRRLGVPVQPRRFIEAVWTNVLQPGLGFAVIATLGQRPVAAAVYLTWHGTLIYKYGASDERFWQARPNNLVMWSAIEWGIENGYRRLDFGRSDFGDAGLRDYKSRWGAVELPLIYSRLGRPAPNAPSRVISLARPIIRWSPAFVCRGAGELLYGRVGMGS